MVKIIEAIGVALSVIGSFSVALGYFLIGYPIFLVSSFCLCYTALRQKNWNLLVLQISFLIANILGILKNSLAMF